MSRLFLDNAGNIMKGLIEVNVFSLAKKGQGCRFAGRLRSFGDRVTSFKIRITRSHIVNRPCLRFSVANAGLWCLKSAHSFVNHVVVQSLEIREGFQPACFAPLDVSPIDFAAEESSL